MLWRGEEGKLGDFLLKEILNLISFVIFLLTFSIFGDIACGSLPL